MQIVFVSNFINHHQVHVADALFNTKGIDYHFIQSTPMPAEFVGNGYPDYTSRPYVIKTYESENTMKLARKMIDEADVVIFGVSPTNPNEWLQKRISQNKVTFHYSERWFKRGLLKYLPSRTIPYFIRNYTFYRNKRLYLLCASAFSHSDAQKILAFPNKCFKWGYFTKNQQLDIDKILELKRDNKKLRLLFIARFLKWKHPELPVKLARYLKESGIDFELNMYGAGPELENTAKLITEMGVCDYVKLCGQLSNEEILKQFRKHDIFLFTSDKNEGWGAVVNEAMSNGCVVVGSNKIGSIPFLVQHKKTGMIFKDQNLNDLIDKVLYLINNPTEREQMARDAYQSMRNVWSPDNAAKNFVMLAKSSLNGKIVPAEDGPCSKA